MKLRYMLLIATLLWATGAANADIVLSGTAGAGFQSWPATWPTSGGMALPQADGATYWANPSQDGTDCGIGFEVRGTAPATCGSQVGPKLTSDDPHGAFPYWGMANGAADPNFYLRHDPLTPDETELEVKITAWLGSSFGYYTFDNGNPTTGNPVLHELFGATSVPENAIGYIPDGIGNFGFYFNTNAGNFFTQSGRNSADIGTQHFALFRIEPPGTTGIQTTHYYIGTEDNVGAAADYDYNDYIIEVTSVPEPASVLLFGTLLLGTCTLFRRYRKA